MLKLFGIIVVYNKNVNESVAYQSLKAQKSLHLVVCDNSTRDYGNRQIVETDGYQYADMKGNAGLSRAYNKALDMIFEHYSDTEGFVMLFDDDTYIPQEYFVQMKETLRKQKADIYLPIVKDEIGVLSPSMMKKYYCHRAVGGEVWKIKKNEICGINSGMAISMDIFKNYRYNEEIFLDYVDHNFIRDMRKLDKKVEIVETYLEQSFSSNIFDLQKELARLDIYKKDINVYYKTGIGNRFFFHYSMMRRKMKLALKYKKINVLFR